MKKFCTLLVSLILLVNVVSAQQLVLEKVTVVSRHSVRAPLDKYLSTLDEMTGKGHQWHRWPVPGSHLTLRGGSLEMLFGEYFRLKFNEKNPFVDGLKETDIYFGASSKQRTIATARAFAAGMFPLMSIPIDFKTKADGSVGYLDPDYLPLLNDSCGPDGFFDTNAFKVEAYNELGTLTPPSYSFLEKMLRMEKSEYAKKHNNEHFDTCVGVCLNFYNKAKNERLEPTMVGGLKDANMASDAFILQYYEMENAKDAAFGRKLSLDEWKKLASIKDYYGYLLFAKAPIIFVNVSHCMLKRVQKELAPGGHKFAFFCTHDSMIEALLAALRADTNYKLENTIEEKTPIGFKLVFEQWTETCCLNPKKYIKVSLVYQSSEQIREMSILDLEHKPMSYEPIFTGIEKTANGMYDYDEFMQHIQKSIEAYNATARGQRPW